MCTEYWCQRASVFSAPKPGYSFSVGQLSPSLHESPAAVEGTLCYHMYCVISFSPKGQDSSAGQDSSDVCAKA